MKERLLPDEAHRKWVAAFSRWYHSSKRDWLISNLDEAVPLSDKDSVFLAAILDGTVKPLSGKQTSQARASNNEIDRAIEDLRLRGFTREQILKKVQEKLRGAGKKEMAIDGLNQRINRLYTKNEVSERMELDIKLAEIYDFVTEKCDN